MDGNGECESFFSNQLTKFIKISDSSDFCSKIKLDENN